MNDLDAAYEPRRASLHGFNDDAKRFQGHLCPLPKNEIQGEKE
jgi:hypothetical protein